MAEVEVGAIVKGKVTGLKPFGAFVDLEDGRNGLVHISQVADDYIKDINDYLEVGQEVKVFVEKIEDDGKISLSMKKAKPREERPRPSSERTNRYKQTTRDFDSMMSQFLKDSDDRLASLKRSTEGRRGNRSRSRR